MKRTFTSLAAASCLVLLGVGIARAQQANSVNVSKSTTYSVVEPPDSSISVSKSSTYAVVEPPDSGLSVSKLSNYAVVEPPDSGLSVSKLTTYAVVEGSYAYIFIMGE